MAQRTLIKWRMSEAPTEPFRSFHRRAWPLGYFDQEVVFRLTCADKYKPARVRTGHHGPVRVMVAIPSKDPAKDGAFTWRRLREEFATLGAAKAGAETFFRTNATQLKLGKQSCWAEEYSKKEGLRHVRTSHARAPSARSRVAHRVQQWVLAATAAPRAHQRA